MLGALIHQVIDAVSYERSEAALLRALYRSFEPAQRRSGRKRQCRYPGQSAPEVAEAPPSQVSYLDGLGV